MSLSRDIQKIVEIAYRDAGNESVVAIINERIAQYIKSMNLERDARKLLEGEARETLNAVVKNRDEKKTAEFARKHGTSEATRRDMQRNIRPAIDLALGSIERASSKILHEVSRIVIRRDGKDEKKLERLLKDRIEKGTVHVKTEIETAKAALSRITRVTDSLNSGFEHFRYDGPSVNLREKCAEWLSIVLHITDIRKLDNNQGLPVEFYCGGYKCRHRWTGVPSQIEGWQKNLQAEAEQFFRDNPGAAKLLKGATPTDIANGFNPGRASIGLNSIEFHFQDKKLQFAASVNNAAGDTVGKIHRIVNFDRGRASVKHELLAFKEQYRGKGMAKSFWRSALPMYDKIGVGKVYTTAALDDGHYTWATWGFQFHDAAARTAWMKFYTFGITQTCDIPYTESAEYVMNLRTPQEFLRLRLDINGRKFDGDQFKRSVGFPWHAVMNIKPGTKSRANLNNLLGTNGQTKLF